MQSFKNYLATAGNIYIYIYMYIYIYSFKPNTAVVW